MSEPLPEQFDPVLHSGPRITIMSRMVVRQVIGFAALQNSTTLTAGNLSTHLDVLAKAGYVALDVDEKKVVRRKTIRITPAGDAAFRAYVRQVRAILEGLNADLTTSVGNHPAPG